MAASHEVLIVTFRLAKNAWAADSQEPCNAGVVEDPPATATMSSINRLNMITT